jgi:cytochrome c556
MKKHWNSMTIAVAAAALLITAGCGGGGGAAADDTPEGRAYVFRHSVMELLAQKVGMMRGMANGEIPLDRAAFVKSASDAATLAGMATEGFEQEGIVAMSRATPEIWANMADFDSRAQTMIDAVTAVANAAQGGDIDGAQELLGDVGSTCGGCHNTYRGDAP